MEKIIKKQKINRVQETDVIYINTTKYLWLCTWIPTAILSVGFFYLALFSLVTEGGGDAVLDGFDPGLSQFLWVSLHHTAPVGTHEHHTTAVCVCACVGVCVCVRMCVCMWQEVGTLLLHLPIFSNIFKCSLGWGKTTFDWWLKLTWWVTPLQNRSDALCPHSVWLYIVSGLLPPL